MLLVFMMELVVDGVLRCWLGGTRIGLDRLKRGNCEVLCSA
jgi:hypothetical protein